MTEKNRVYRFGRMFPDLDPFQPKDGGLVELGNTMQEGLDLGDHPGLPAGYTYLAQFLAHDVSLDLTRDIPEDTVSLNEVKQGRTPFLDLDCLYGDGPESTNDRRLYKDDLVRMQLGVTSSSAFGDARREYQNDLPRGLNPARLHEATIADPRNDENLAVAQLHVAFLRFHNKVATLLSQDNLPADVHFQKTREKVVLHYQWMILNDFLPRIIDEDVLKDVLARGPQHFKLDRPDKPFMPIEFSLAAFRLGHSMLRDTYEWNRVFQSSPQGRTKSARLDALFRLTGFRGIGTMDGTGDRLPSNWIIDWTRFIDFSGFNGIANNPKFNRAGLIDTTIAPGLKMLEPFFTQISNPAFRSLAVLDLVRGSRLGLPSGQDVATALGVTPLSPSEVADEEPHRSVLMRHEFDRQTPLWYYILKEAQLYRGGERLGPVGSNIVAETVIGLIDANPISIRKKDQTVAGNQSDWKPDLGQKQRDQFGMADLLVFANAVNPLGS